MYIVYPLATLFPSSQCLLDIMPNTIILSMLNKHGPYLNSNDIQDVKALQWDICSCTAVILIRNKEKKMRSIL